MPGKLKIRRFANITEAQKTMMPPEKEFICVWHKLKPEEKISKHRHPAASECLIADQGEFWVSREDESEKFNLNKTKGAIAIHFPPQSVHSLLAVSELYYCVIKSEADVTIFVDKNGKAKRILMRNGDLIPVKE